MSSLFKEILPIELIPAISVAIGGGYLLHRPATGRTENIRDTGIVGSSGRCQFSIGMEEVLDADGGDQQR